MARLPSALRRRRTHERVRQFVEGLINASLSIEGVSFFVFFVAMISSRRVQQLSHIRAETLRDNDKLRDAEIAMVLGKPVTLRDRERRSLGLIMGKTRRDAGGILA